MTRSASYTEGSIPLTTSIRKAWKVWAPPPRLTVSQWADAQRQLSPEDSAEPGQWRTERAEYQRGPMDAVNDPLVEEVVLEWASQTGKTQVLLNITAYFMDQDPCPILYVNPTLEMAESWSKDRLAPMLRDTPALAGKVYEAKSRDANNTIRRKIYPRGSLDAAGANSPASLAARPKRLVICDEVDRYPRRVGQEGSPVSIAFVRTKNFWNRKKIQASSPTVKGDSPIDEAYQRSDRRKFWVPCPHCEQAQVLRWRDGGIAGGGEYRVRWPQGRPEEAVYVCEFCQQAIDDADKIRMVRAGQWRAEAAFRGTAGFWLSELYSPWSTWGQLATQWVAVQGDPHKLQVFVNTSLAEVWEERPGDRVQHDVLYQRRERYAAEVPAGALVLTAGVDLQPNRIEVEVIGWGREEESWGIEYRVFYGSPAEPAVWRDLDQFLQKTYRHELGVDLRIAAVGVDTGGHHTKEAYDWIKPRQDDRRIYAMKGANVAGAPLVGRPGTHNLGKVLLFMIGTDAAKVTIYGRLKIRTPGPGFMHFPEAYDEEYFRQLTAEKLDQYLERGRMIRRWVKQRERNEALDCRVYAMAALAILQPAWDKIAESIEARAARAKQEPGEPGAAPPAAPRKPGFARRFNRGGFVGGWGRKR